MYYQQLILIIYINKGCMDILNRKLYLNTCGQGKIKYLVNV